MQSTLKPEAPVRVTLPALTAEDLMTPNPVSIRDLATIPEAVALLTDKGFSAAPVIDEAGRPVGVLSRTDLLVHDREKGDYVGTAPEYYERTELAHRVGTATAPAGYQIVNVDRAMVRDLMTPVVFSVKPDAPVTEVIRQLLKLRVHRLFVVDRVGALIGVISALDILRHLQGI
jgi:CBS domain-containing protein